MHSTGFSLFPGIQSFCEVVLIATHKLVEPKKPSRDPRSAVANAESLVNATATSVHCLHIVQVPFLGPRLLL